jgi:hypothetical protein
MLVNIQEDCSERNETVTRRELIKYKSLEELD